MEMLSKKETGTANAMAETGSVVNDRGSMPRLLNDTTGFYRIKIGFLLRCSARAEFLTNTGELKYKSKLYLDLITYLNSIYNLYINSLKIGSAPNRSPEAFVEPESGKGFTHRDKGRR